MPLRAVTAEDLDLYRSIRLRALRTDPEAFGSNHDREAAFDDETWLSRMLTFKGQPGAIFVDVDGTDEAVAVTGIGLLDDPAMALVWGMWVAPEARRTGAARRLMDAALTWASANSAEVVGLDVVRTNTNAIALYQSIGFLPVESVVRAADDPCSDELRMELSLRVD